jgi:hypothetical protein
MRALFLGVIIASLPIAALAEGRIVPLDKDTFAWEGPGGRIVRRSWEIWPNTTGEGGGETRHGSETWSTGRGVVCQRQAHGSTVTIRCHTVTPTSTGMRA